MPFSLLTAKDVTGSTLFFEQEDIEEISLEK